MSRINLDSLLTDDEIEPDIFDLVECIREGHTIQSTAEQSSLYHGPHAASREEEWSPNRPKKFVLDKNRTVQADASSALAICLSAKRSNPKISRQKIYYIKQRVRELYEQKWLPREILQKLRNDGIRSNIDQIKEWCNSPPQTKTQKTDLTLAFPCEKCGAKEGKPCETTGGVPSYVPHSIRIRALMRSRI